MRKLFTRSFICYFYLVVICLSVSNNAIAKSDSTIQINNEIHALVAPEGNHYQWFKDNQPLQGE